MQRWRCSTDTLIWGTQYQVYYSSLFGSVPKHNLDIMDTRPLYCLKKSFWMASYISLTTQYSSTIPKSKLICRLTISGIKYLVEYEKTNTYKRRNDSGVPKTYKMVTVLHKNMTHEIVGTFQLFHVWLNRHVNVWNQHGA